MVSGNLRGNSLRACHIILPTPLPSNPQSPASTDSDLMVGTAFDDAPFDMSPTMASRPLPSAAAPAGDETLMTISSASDTSILSGELVNAFLDLGGEPGASTP